MKNYDPKQSIERKINKMNRAKRLLKWKKASVSMNSNLFGLVWIKRDEKRNENKTEQMDRQMDVACQHFQAIELTEIGMKSKSKRETKGIKLQN